MLAPSGSAAGPWLSLTLRAALRQLNLESQNFWALHPENDWEVPPATFTGNQWKDKDGVYYVGTWKNGTFFGEVPPPS